MATRTSAPSIARNAQARRGDEPGVFHFLSATRAKAKRIAAIDGWQTAPATLDPDAGDDPLTDTITWSLITNRIAVIGRRPMD